MREFNGFLATGLKLFRKEGLKGLYRGWPPNVILVMPEKAIKLTMNDVFRRQLRNMRTKKDLPFLLEVTAGGLAGFTQGQTHHCANSAEWTNVDTQHQVEA